MAHLRVLLHGQIISDLQLESGQEYTAGRGSQCHILLASERGISRQHIRIYEENGQWQVQLTAKYGGIISGNESVEHLLLTGETQFSIPPYEFYFSELAAQENLTPPMEAIAEPIEAPAEEPAPTYETLPEPDGNLDATVAGVSNLVGYVKIINNKLKTEEVLRLEGNAWSVGRHPACEIVINDSAISRQHFDLNKTPEGYFIIDHGSSNGTKLNGERIPAETPQKLTSGDVISVREIELVFEIHDGEYAQKVQNLPAVIEDLVPAGSLNELPSNPMAEFTRSDVAPAVLKIPPPKHRGPEGFKPNKIQIIIGVLAVVLIFGLLSGPEKSQDTNQHKSDLPSAQPAGADQLTPEKRKEVRDVFNLAHGYYLQRKYTMCISTLEKLHNLVAFYENSKDVENLCRQAQELEQIEQDRRRKEEARFEAENKIRQYIADCKAQIKPTTTSAELTICLQPALELDPQNAGAMDLILQVESKEAAQKDQLARQADFQRRKQEGQVIFNRAVTLYKNGQLKQALQEFRRYKNGRYPGLNQFDDAAERNISSIQKSLSDTLNQQIANCQSALDRQDLKGAYNSCDQVLKENPNNKEAQEIKNKAFGRLRKEMKPLYEDAAFEESVGNIESAKEKWKKIVETSVPKDDYYRKAQQKLKKYGEGF